MKVNDYMRLAKISLNSRKKNTRSTVRGIAFGLIFIVPVIFIALGVYVDLTAKINKVPEALNMSISAGDERSGFEAKYSENGYNSYPSTSYLKDAAAVADGEKYYYEQLTTKRSYSLLTQSSELSVGEAFTMDVDGEQSDYYYRAPTGNGANLLSYNFAAILDEGRSTAIDGGLLRSKKLEDRYGGLYVSGMDKGFSGDGKGQVIVSEEFLITAGRTAANTYGKRISISFRDYVNGTTYDAINIDSDSVVENNDFASAQGFAANSKQITLIGDYEVVGVIKQSVTVAALSDNGYSNNSYILSLMQNAMFFTSASRDVGGGAAEPKVNTYTSDQEGYYSGSVFVATYADDFDSYAGEYICTGANDFTSLFRGSIWHNENDTYYSEEFYAPAATLLIDAKDYAELDRIVTQVTSVSTELFPEQTRAMVMRFTTSVYSNISMIYFMFTFIILGLSIFGGIIFFSSIVNLFNSIAHSVDSRKHYLGVMRAIGGTGGMIAGLYLAESLTIFRRAAIWISIFATAICVGIWLLVNLGFSYMNEFFAAAFGFELALNLGYAFVALAVSLVVLVLIGVAFSYLLSRNVASKPITEILVD